MDSQGNRMKVVYTVVERQPGKSFWTRVGVGFVNHDGSLNLRLDAIPINGVMQVRDWEPRDERKDEGMAAPGPQRARPQRDAATGTGGLV